MWRQTPSSGASSIAPFSLMHSAWTPRAAKWRRVTSGYFVATRRWLQLCGSSCAGPLGRRGHGHTAMPDIEIERRVDLGIIELHQHVVAGDPELGGAEGDEGRDIEAAHPDQVERRVGGRETAAAGSPDR